MFGLRNVYMFLRREQKKKVNEARGETMPDFTPSAVVIIPVKGADPNLAHHMQGLLEQNYPSFKLIFATEADDDAAFVAIRDYLGGGFSVSSLPESEEGDGTTVLTWQPADVSADKKRSSNLRLVQLISAGLAQNEAQKVHNQIAAMQLMDDGDEAVVYADADAVMGDDWLRKIIRPLYRPTIGVATAWRWLLPEHGPKSSLATHVACIINSSIVTLQGRDRRNCAWGGSMAVLRTTLDEIDMPKPWRGTFNDDVNLSNAVQAKGKRVYLVPNMLVNSPVSFTWPSLFEFGRRQYMHARVYQPATWIVGPLATSLYLFGFFSALISLACLTTTWPIALFTLLAVFTLDFFRGRFRRQVAHTTLDDQAQEKLRGIWKYDMLFTPFWMLVHWICAISSFFGHCFTWGGITYRIHAPHDIEIIDRK